MLKKCSKRKGLKGFLLRKDLLTKIKQCDVELSNVLQAFQVRALFLFIYVNHVVCLPVGRVVVGRPRRVERCEDRGMVHTKCTSSWLT